MNREFYTDFKDARWRLEYWTHQAQSQPVMVMKDGKAMGVIVSHQEYLRFTRGDRKIVVTRELDPDEIVALQQEKPF